MRYGLVFSRPVFGGNDSDKLFRILRKIQFGWHAGLASIMRSMIQWHAKF